MEDHCTENPQSNAWHMREEDLREQAQTHVEYMIVGVPGKECKRNFDSGVVTRALSTFCAQAMVGCPTLQQARGFPLTYTSNVPGGQEALYLRQSIPTYLKVHACMWRNWVDTKCLWQQWTRASREMARKAFIHLWCTSRVLDLAVTYM